MPDTTLEPAVAIPPAPSLAPSGDAVLRDALMESRQRWRHLVGLAADLAFETDADGRFVFVMPDTALGWPAGSLIGQRSQLLLVGDGAEPEKNPFCPPAEIRRQPSWLRCADGTLIMLSMSATPLHDITGRRAGARGVGIELADAEYHAPHIALRLRRGEMLDQILLRVSRESDVGAMMDTVLWSLVNMLEAEGAAVIGSRTQAATLDVLHECGPGAFAIFGSAVLLLGRGSAAQLLQVPDGRSILAVSCPTRFDTNAGLVLWREAGAPAWQEHDLSVAGAVVGVVRMILDYEAVQQDMALQARTDPLTGLLNRRAFLEEVRRQIAQLDRDSAPGTLLFIDLDGFKSVNDRLGHAMGDTILSCVAERLRKMVRPNDVTARFGGDEFAVWLSGADHLTAAERAEHLCKTLPDELQALLPEAIAGVGLSIGIATRWAASEEKIEDLMLRADLAMYQVKRDGRGHWRVALVKDAS